MLPPEQGWPTLLEAEILVIAFDIPGSVLQNRTVVLGSVSWQATSEDWCRQGPGTVLRLEH